MEKKHSLFKGALKRPFTSITSILHRKSSVKALECPSVESQVLQPSFVDASNEIANTFVLPGPSFQYSTENLTQAYQPASDSSKEVQALPISYDPRFTANSQRTQANIVASAQNNGNGCDTTLPAKFPSPLDYNPNRKTPLERMEDIHQLQNLLSIPTPVLQPQMVEMYKQNQEALSQLQKSKAGTSPSILQPDFDKYDTLSQGVPLWNSSEHLEAVRQGNTDPINTLCIGLSHQRLRNGSQPALTGAAFALNDAAFCSGMFETNGLKETMQSSTAESSLSFADPNRTTGQEMSLSFADPNRTTGQEIHRKEKLKVPYRRKHCKVDGCLNLSRSSGLCKAHGGGRRCTVEGCSRASQSSNLCIAHGGGRRCQVSGCPRAAQSRGMCKGHGGGARCTVPNCARSSQGNGLCRTHGGGRKCEHISGCDRWAQKNGLCIAHAKSEI